MTQLIGLFDEYSNAVDRVVLCCPDGPVTRQQLLAAATGVSQALAAAPFVINLCKDRHQFIVGFGAALIAGSSSLLPANRQFQTIAGLIERYPDSVILVDDDSTEFAPFACVNIRTVAPAVLGPDSAQPKIAADHIAAIVFTSGSSGQPTAIAKPWRTFVGTTRLLAQRFIHRQQRASIVATVPPQHMYGLETTVMMALHGGVVVHSGQPFYGEDIRIALEQVAEPRILVTTPVHLAALTAAPLALPALAQLISATAPLPVEQALLAEQQLGCQLSEIFGCSEAGSFASRRTGQEPHWTMLDTMTISAAPQSGQAAAMQVSADHLSAAVVLQDRLQLIDPGHFAFIGRSSDMLNVAGKRASLADLSLKLQQLEGVDDGVFFLPEQGGVASRRPAALVVSGLSERAILSALAALIDPVFLPRPLKKVAAIPRNEVGKIPRQLLQQQLQSSAAPKL